MSKAVLLSIKPRYCQLIINGQKTMEIRKTKPKLETPFKCYIYCTKAKERFTHGGLVETLDDLFRMPNKEIKYGYSGELMCNDEAYCKDNFLNGKVIGEFICDTYVVDRTYGHDPLFNGAACISDIEAAVYCTNPKTYGWHISDLKIYDKPIELSEFEKPCPYNYDCWKCKYYFNGSFDEPPHCDLEDFGVIECPPQSWCYVEEI